MHLSKYSNKHSNTQELFTLYYMEDQRVDSIMAPTRQSSANVPLSLARYEHGAFITLAVSITTRLFETYFRTKPESTTPSGSHLAWVNP